MYNDLEFNDTVCEFQCQRQYAEAIDSGCLIAEEKFSFEDFFLWGEQLKWKIFIC